MGNVGKGAAVNQLPADGCRKLRALFGAELAAELLYEAFGIGVLVIAAVVGAFLQYVGGKIILRVTGGRGNKGFGVNIPLAAAQKVGITVRRVNF